MIGNFFIFLFKVCQNFEKCDNNGIFHRECISEIENLEYDGIKFICKDCRMNI